jgi:hypothetical protein
MYTLGSQCTGEDAKELIKNEMALRPNIPFCDAISILRHTCNRLVKEQAQTHALSHQLTAMQWQERATFFANRENEHRKNNGLSLILNDHAATVQEKVELRKQNYKLQQQVQYLTEDSLGMRRRLWQLESRAMDGNMKRFGFQTIQQQATTTTTTEDADDVKAVKKQKCEDHEVGKASAEAEKVNEKS